MFMNALAQQFREEIQRRGPVPFAEFMFRALYDPEHGYYSKAARQIGKRGDFMTSVSVGSFFGELLAFQFARWLGSLREHDARLQIVESGAHDGRLAHDILESIEREKADLFATLDYWIVEPSPARRGVQQQMLARFHNVRWWENFSEMVARVRGVIFANELLDAMPVHPFAWNAERRSWEEMGVTVSGEAFNWTRLERTTVPAPSFPEALLDVLPDGYIVELSPAVRHWWRGAAMALACGRVMTIDYGGAIEELLSPGRTSGTLRAYARHRVGNDVLANPGEQDITAHVNFTEIQHEGETAGLKTELFTTQSIFLTHIARELWTERGSWPQNQVRQFQTLTHPEHLGRPFKVLVQAREIGAAPF
jgi:SAM-dependent MidA family methyltransferase